MQNAEITEEVLLIRIGSPRTFKDTPFPETAAELYDRTRGCWVVGERTMKPKLAFSVYDGVVQEVYNIDCWENATLERPHSIEGRKQFAGTVNQEMSGKYKGKSVKHYFRQGSANPVTTLNCP
jgi:hypothetical protein